MLPNNQISATIGDLITLEGHHLAGESGEPADVTVSAGFIHLRNRSVPAIPISVANRTTDSASFRLNAPNAERDYPAGVYGVHLAIIPGGDASKQRDTNDLALVIAPKIIGPRPMPMTFVRSNVDPTTGLGDATIDLTCSPDVLPEQRVTLVIGDREIAAEAHSTQTSDLTFIARRMAGTMFRVRLRVDGIESHLIDRTTAGKPAFDETQQVTLI